jgi:hypothetical protein
MYFFGPNSPGILFNNFLSQSETQNQQKEEKTFWKKSFSKNLKRKKSTLLVFNLNHHCREWP